MSRATRERSSRRVRELTALAEGRARSGSRVEDAFWEDRLARAVDRVLRAGRDEDLNQALDELARGPVAAYDTLMSEIEARCETAELGDGRLALLVAVPVLAWSRSEIPAPRGDPDLLANLAEQLRETVFADGVSLALGDRLLSPEQLPQGFAETARLTERLGRAADGAGRVEMPADLPPPAGFLADARYVLGAAVVDPRAPVFGWNDAGITREEVLGRWREAAGPTLSRMLPRCALDLLLPDACHAAWRETDRALRPFVLRGCVTYLEAVLGLAPTALRAVVAPVRDGGIVEYRVALLSREDDSVLQGAVWTLFDNEAGDVDTQDEIRAVLEDSGVSEITALRTPVAAEYCEDCGAPLFPDPGGELAHAGIPEHLEPVSSSLH